MSKSIDPVPSRFDFVLYDEIAKGKQAKFKLATQRVESAMNALIEAQNELESDICSEFYGETAESMETAADFAREELAESGLFSDCFRRLEQAYMWVGKAIRDDQINRNGSAPLQEERVNS